MKKQKRQVIKQLLQCVAIVTVGTLAIILFMFVIWNDRRGAETITDEQVAAEMQQAETLVMAKAKATTVFMPTTAQFG